MKFFHLADLHIGKSVKEISMLEEQKHIFGQIHTYVQEEKPGAVVVAGDVYDRVVPSAQAVELYDDFLTGLVATGVPVLVVSGNHDSPERLAFAGRIMQKSGVNIYSIYDGTLHTQTLRDEFGEVVFHLLPFVRPAVVRPFFPEDTIESYGAALQAALHGQPANKAGRNVLVAHQFITAAGHPPQRADSETEPVGGLNAADTALFDAFDYVALGHLHGPQKVGRSTVRYAGSPLKYSFSEVAHKKGLTMVEMGPKGQIEISVLPLYPLREMRKIRGPLAQLTAPAVVQDANAEDYLHVTLTDEQEVPDALARLRRVYPNVMELVFDNSRTRAASAFEGEAQAEMKNDEELLEDFFKEQNDRPLTAGQRAAALVLLRKMEEDN